MNIYHLEVINAGRDSSPCPGLRFYGQWLPDMGFIPGALVQAIPEPGGMTFTLFNENIKSYSELFYSTQKQGGKLIQTYYAGSKENHCLLLTTSGKYLLDAGIDFGDTLIACYEPGFIRVRKLPSDTKAIQVSSVKYSYMDKPLPEIRLIGNWLSELGFIPDFLVTSASVPGSITFSLHSNDGIKGYSELVKHARLNKMKLLKVCELLKWGKLYPSIKVSGSCIDKAGFAVGDTLLASYEHGQISLQKLDFNGLGF